MSAVSTSDHTALTDDDAGRGDADVDMDVDDDDDSAESKADTDGNDSGDDDAVDIDTTHLQSPDAAVKSALPITHHRVAYALLVDYNNETAAHEIRDHRKPLVIGAAATVSQVTIDCPTVSAKHAAITFDPFLRRWHIQCIGRYGLAIMANDNAVAAYDASPVERLLSSPSIIRIGCDNAEHFHAFHFLLPPHSKDRGAVWSAPPVVPRSERSDERIRRDQLALKSSDIPYWELNNPTDWSDSEQLRFQRCFLSVGLNKIYKIREVALLTKKNNQQIWNYACAFMEECKRIISEQLSEDEEEIIYIDLVIKRYNLHSQRSEPTLHKWKKLQSNALVWIRRLRSIQLLEDIILRAESLDIDVLVLLPTAAKRLSQALSPAWWWTNAHDRILLRAVYEHGYCRYEDIRLDDKYAFYVTQRQCEVHAAEIAAMKAASVSGGDGSVDGHAFYDQSMASSGGGGGSGGGDDKRRRKKRRTEDDDEDELDDDVNIADDDDDGDGNPNDMSISNGDDVSAVEHNKESESGDRLIDVRNGTEFDLSWPAPDALTRRMKRLIEIPRMRWYTYGNQNKAKERAKKVKVIPAPVPTHEQRIARSADIYKRIKHNGEPLTRAECEALMSALCQFGLVRDTSGRIDWSRLRTLSVDKNRQRIYDNALTHIAADVYMHTSVPSPFQPPQHNPHRTFALPPPAFTPLATQQQSDLIRQRLHFFAQLRERVLTLHDEQLNNIASTDCPPLPSAPEDMLPPWWKRCHHDLCLLRGIDRFGIGEWRQMMQDETLQWRTQNEQTMSDNTAIKLESSALDISLLEPTHFDALQQRADRLVSTFSAYNPVPLTTTINALAPFVTVTRPSHFPYRLTASKRRGDNNTEHKRTLETEMDAAHNQQFPLLTLNKYDEYLAPFYSSEPALAAPAVITPYDVTALSVSCVTAKFNRLKRLISHPQSRQFAMDKERDSMLTITHRRYIDAKTAQTILPLQILGGLTVYSFGQVRSEQCILLDEDDNVPWRSNGRHQHNDRSIVAHSHSDQTHYLCPIGFSSVRVHQSIADPNRFCRYKCEITSDAAEPLRPIFVVTSSDDPTRPLTALHPTALWMCIEAAIMANADATVHQHHQPHPHHIICGFERFGLVNPQVVTAIEHTMNQDIMQRCFTNGYEMMQNRIRIQEYTL